MRSCQNVRCLSTVRKENIHFRQIIGSYGLGKRPQSDFGGVQTVFHPSKYPLASLDTIVYYACFELCNQT